MGIYPENKVYGIRWFTHDEKGGKHIIYEIAHDSIMTKEQLQITKDAFIRFQETAYANDKQDVVYQVLIDVWTTYDSPPCSTKSWWSWNITRPLKPWDDGFDVYA